MFYSELSLDREENHGRRDSLVLENISRTGLSLFGERLWLFSEVRVVTGENQ